MTSISADATQSSPWLSAWFKPRQTIAGIVATNPRRHVLLLAALGTIATIVSELLIADGTTLLRDWRVIVAVILGGAIIGAIALYWSGFFLRWSGHLFGGHASYAQVRAAVAWSQLPTILGAAICLALFAGLRLAGGKIPSDAVTAALSLVVGVTTLWTLVMAWLMFAGVQNFGFWRAVISAVIGWAAATLAVIILCALPFRTFAFQPFNIPSGSMKPTLQVGDYLFVSKYPYGYTRYSLPFSWPLFSGRILAAEPKRGDVVVYRLPKDDRVDYISRVVGLPGDRIQMVNGELRINGEPVKRERADDFVETEDGRTVKVKRWRETLPDGVTYETLDLLDNGFLDNTQQYQVPAGHYFMMSDNRDNATDSRVLNQVGYVPFENIVGRAAMIFYPAGRFGTMVR